jgi:lysyl-tRNA synthetase class 2
MISEHPQFQERHHRLAKWRAIGVDPYGTRLDGVQPVLDVKALHTESTPHEGTQIARICGRIVLLRDIGKLIFITVQDSSGKLQIGLTKQMLAADWEKAKLLELGDIAWFEGKVGHTNTGEVTIWATAFGLSAKALLPLPDKFHGLTDTELRYRQRYLDLAANSGSMSVFQARSRIMAEIRSFLHQRKFIEVETPMMQSMAGGAAARPFLTHHNALDIDLYLRVSPELFLKRLLVGGMERVFEINRNFRNEGIDTRHNPEFTMMELYEAYSDLSGMMELTETLVATLAENEARLQKKTDGRVLLPFGDRQIDYTSPFERIAYGDLFQKHVGVAMEDDAAVRKAAADCGITHSDSKDADVLRGELFERFAEPSLKDYDRPVFVFDYPAGLCPLTRRKGGNPSIAERFELYVAGMELANAYTELNDPEVQYATLSAQLAGLPEHESMARMDHDFVTALCHGMPPAGGLGIGIDRLIMLLTNCTSIRDVILFPLLRPALRSANDPAVSAPNI